MSGYDFKIRLDYLLRNRERHQRGSKSTCQKVFLPRLKTPLIQLSNFLKSIFDQKLLALLDTMIGTEAFSVKLNELL